MAIGAAVVGGLSILQARSAGKREEENRAQLIAAGQEASQVYNPFYSWGLEALYGPGGVPQASTTTTTAPFTSGTFGTSGGSGPGGSMTSTETFQAAQQMGMLGGDVDEESFASSGGADRMRLIQQMLGGGTAVTRHPGTTTTNGVTTNIPEGTGTALMPGIQNPPFAQGAGALATAVGPQGATISPSGATTTGGLSGFSGVAGGDQRDPRMRGGGALGKVGESIAQPATGGAPSAGGFTGPLPQDIASLRNLINDPSQIRNDPQYQFLQQEGGRAVGNILSGRGKLLSGQGGRNFQSFGQTLASTFLDSIINRRMTGINTLFSQLGVGERAATGRANAIVGQSTNVATTLQGTSPLLSGLGQGAGAILGMQQAGMFSGGSTRTPGGGGQITSGFGTGGTFAPISAFEHTSG